MTPFNAEPGSAMETDTSPSGVREEQRRLWEDETHYRYHARQFTQEYRSTVHLRRFLQRLPLHGGEALDIACGAGANIYHLGPALPEYRWTGVDIVGEPLFAIGRPWFEQRGPAATLVQGDLYALDAAFPERRFDLVLCLQTLSWLPELDEALAQALRLTRGWLVLSSLFSDADVDTRCQAVDHTAAPGLPPHFLNVYSLRRLRELCESHGCRSFVVEDFEIDVDLEPPASGGLGTYTRRLADGGLLQFTGPIYLPWKFVAVQMGG